jgi:hypothetical protein
MNAAEVLAVARAASLCLAVDGAELVLEACGPPPPAVLDLVRAHKAEIIAAISAANAMLPPSPASQKIDDAVVDWRDWYEERAAIRQFDGGYSREEAGRLAKGEAEDRWHRAHGERTPRNLCAGCRRPIGSAEPLDLIDGNRIHLVDLDCLIRHENRWRPVAAQALKLMGIETLLIETRRHPDPRSSEFERELGREIADGVLA